MNTSQAKKSDIVAPVLRRLKQAGYSFEKTQGWAEWLVCCPNAPGFKLNLIYSGHASKWEVFSYYYPRWQIRIDAVYNLITRTGQLCELKA